MGSGECILVQNDAWLSGFASYIIDTQISTGGLALVSDFIEANSRSWKESLIRSTCLKEVASRILKITLAKEAYDDIRVWRGEPSREFSVKSAYKLLHTYSFTSNLFSTHTDPSNY